MLTVKKSLFSIENMIIYKIKTLIIYNKKIRMMIIMIIMKKRSMNLQIILIILVIWNIRHRCAKIFRPKENAHIEIAYLHTLNLNWESYH